MPGKLYALKVRPGGEPKVLPDQTQILRIEPYPDEPGTFNVLVVEVLAGMIATPKLVV